MPVEIDTSSFGNAIASARKALGMSQKELAAKILKEDGTSITPQYLNDIEHDRRSPSSDHMVKEFARVLNIKPEVLYWVAGRIPEEFMKRSRSPEEITNAFTAFRRSLRGQRE